MTPPKTKEKKLRRWGDGKKEGLPIKCIVPDLTIDSNAKLTLLLKTTKPDTPKPDVSSMYNTEK